MPIQCKFHPTQAAHWQCDRCHTPLCPHCINRREKEQKSPGTYLYFCPKCNKEARWLGAGNIIDPFWKRLVKFFIYPFYPRPLYLMLIFSFIILICTEHPGILSITIVALLHCAILLYSFAALKHTAKGNLTPPPLNKSTLSDDIALVFKQLGIYLLIGLAVFFTMGKIGVLPGIAILILSLLGLPAMVILLVTTGSLIQAVNPMMFVPLATRIGWGYLLMYLFLILLGGAPQALAGWLVPLLPPRSLPFIFSYAKFYYMLISYHLMGYVLMQYHMEIGYSIDQDAFRETDAVTVAEPEDPDERTLHEVELLLRGGDVEAAIALIKDGRNPEAMRSLELSVLYMKMLKLKKMATALNEHLFVHLRLLVDNGEKAGSLKLYGACLRKDAAFLPSPEILFKLAGWLYGDGKVKPALSIFSRLVASHPDSPVTAQAHLRMAQIYNDRLFKPKKALEILDNAIEDFSNDEIVNRLKAYRASMQSAAL
jgi:tetratricopeptide (TPR) repeat protein